MKSKYLSTLLSAAVCMVISPVAGRAGNGLAALQTGDPSCGDDTGAIYVDCENGTVTDNRTGLIWLANANCWQDLDWHDAMAAVAGLSDIPNGTAGANDDCGLDDGSSPGEWRLPSIDEWEAMIDDALGQGGDPDCLAAGGPTITNDEGTGCWGSVGGSFSNILNANYWSTTTVKSSTSDAWDVHLGWATISDMFGKSSTGFVWPVRGGQ